MLIVVNGYGYLDNNFDWSHKQLPVYQDGMNHTVFTHLLSNTSEQIKIPEGSSNAAYQPCTDLILQSSQTSSKTYNITIVSSS